MLNFHLLNILTNFRCIRIYLGILSALGASVLLEILLLLKLATIIGLWMTMATLAVNTATGIFFMYFLTASRNRQLTNSVNSGRYDLEVFYRYLSSLTASFLIITPGLLNSLLGLVFLLPEVSVMLGRKISLVLGLDWQKSYEFLRLTRMADAQSE